MSKGKGKKLKWEQGEVATQHVKISDKEFSQRLDELAEILYQYFYQLEMKSTCLKHAPRDEEERAGA